MKLAHFAAASLFFNIISCTPQTAMDKASTGKLISGKEFAFVAKSAIPTNYDVINVINSLPNGASTRMLQLDYGYGYTLKNGQLEVALPYFGRRDLASMDRDKESFRFVSKNYNINESLGRKGSKIIKIQPRDVPYIREITTEIFPNGTAYVAIDSNDRQAISYSGNISAVRN